MEITLEALVEDITDVVSLPEVATKVNEMVDDPNCGANEIGKVISQEPGLTARLLKITNSSFYGFSAEIDTVSRAITMLGTKQVRNLALATSTIQTFEGIPNKFVSMENFWRHSVLCDLGAQFLASESHLKSGEALFIAGLLHDIGQLVMYNRAPEQSAEALSMVVDDVEEPEIYVAERNVFGFDHMKVGAELARGWHLPRSLESCIEFHHEPSKAKEHKVDVAVIHIANALAVMVELDTTDINAAPPIDASAYEITGCSKDVIEPVIMKVKEHFDGMCSSLGIK